MRGFRKTGWNDESFAVFDRHCREYRKKFWKSTSPYSRRSHLCARALKMMERLNKHAFYIESVKVSARYPDQKRWQ